MPIHDWTRVPAGLFHRFPPALDHRDRPRAEPRPAAQGGRGAGGTTVGAARGRRSGHRAKDEAPAHRTGRRRRRHGTSRHAHRPPHRSRRFYSGRANRIVVRHHLGRIIAVIEVLSPGNKDSRAALRDFVEKTIDFLRKGIHVLIVDLFPPTPRDPFGMHKVIWDEIVEEDFAFPPGKDRILASYETGGERAAYVEPVAVGDPLPDMPLFLTNEVLCRGPAGTDLPGDLGRQSRGNAPGRRNGRDAGTGGGIAFFRLRRSVTTPSFPRSTRGPQSSPCRR